MTSLTSVMLGFMGFLAGVTTAQAAELSQKSIATLELACTAKDAASCNELHTRYYVGSGVASDRAKAADYKRLSCEGGDAASCVTYAAGMQTGRMGYPSQNRARAAGYALQACRLGNNDGCGLAASFASAASPAITNQAERDFVFDKVCDAGDVRACEKAAYAEGNAKNWHSAAVYAQKACKLGSSSACSNVNAYTVRLQNSQQRAATRVTTQPSSQSSTQPRQQPQQKPFKEAGPSENGNTICGYNQDGSYKTRYQYKGFDNKMNYGPCM